MKKAQGLVSLADKYHPKLIEQAAAIFLKQHLTINYKFFKKMIEKIKSQKQQTTIQLSQQSLQFVREMDYFIHNN